MDDIASRFKEFRVSMGNMSQVELAKRLGITSAHISKIEKGVNTPSESLIKHISKEFCINEKWLLEGKGYMDKDELEDAIDDKMITSTNKISKMLKRRDEPELRLAVAKLNYVFSDIVDIDKITNGRYMDYLELCENLLKNINKYTEALVAFSIAGIIPETTLNTKLLFDTYSAPILRDLKSLQDFFIEENND